MSYINQLPPQPHRILAYKRELESGAVLPFHQHDRDQLIYASQGIMAVSTPQAAFVIPPQRAVWMPAGTEHSITTRSPVSIRTLYILPGIGTGLPTEVCVLQVSLLLRELIVAVCDEEMLYDQGSPAARMMPVILDQIARQPTAALTLPIPTDSRALAVTQGLMNNPADSRELAAWAQAVGCSKRTLGRLFSQETGLTFQQWRQQRRLLRAVELLSSDESVTNIALELGYDNTSAFIAMFRRCLGTSPSRYLATASATT